jgi:hypothetical protein
MPHTLRLAPLPRRLQMSLTSPTSPTQVTVFSDSRRTTFSATCWSLRHPASGWEPLHLFDSHPSTLRGNMTSRKPIRTWQRGGRTRLAQRGVPLALFRLMRAAGLTLSGSRRRWSVSPAPVFPDRRSSLWRFSRFFASRIRLPATAMTPCRYLSRKP